MNTLAICKTTVTSAQLTESALGFDAAFKSRADIFRQLWREATGIASGVDSSLVLAELEKKGSVFSTAQVTQSAWATQWPAGWKNVKELKSVYSASNKARFALINEIKNALYGDQANTPKTESEKADAKKEVAKRQLKAAVDMLTEGLPSIEYRALEAHALTLISKLDMDGLSAVKGAIDRALKASKKAAAQ